jgi:hypothetical protein
MVEGVYPYLSKITQIYRILPDKKWEQGKNRQYASGTDVRDRSAEAWKDNPGGELQ